MIAVALAALVVIGSALIIARQRRRPEPRRVRVEAEDRRKRPPR